MRFEPYIAKELQGDRIAGRRAGRGPWRYGLQGLALAAGLYCAGGWAIDIEVDRLIDENDLSCNDGDCSLRDAITVAADGDRVIVPAGTYVLTLGTLAPTASIDIVGAGARQTIISANDASRVFTVNGADAAIDVSIRAMTLRDGLVSGTGRGGAVQFVQASGLLQDCVVRNSSAFNAGGIAVDSGSDLVIDRCLISENLAAGNSGGGLVVSGSTLTLTDSTVSNNKADSAGRSGGGMIVGGGFSSPPSTVIVRNSTIVENASAEPGGGISTIGEGGQVEISNSVVANNSPTDCGSDFLPPEDVAITSLGWNLDSDDSCDLGAPGDLAARDPKLLPLALNGGSSPNHFPDQGSPLVDAGNPASAGGSIATCTSVDQRGYLLAAGDLCDIGAVESDGLEPPLFRDRFELPD